MIHFVESRITGKTEVLFMKIGARVWTYGSISRLSPVAQNWLLGSRAKDQSIFLILHDFTGFNVSLWEKNSVLLVKVGARVLEL